MKSDGTLDGKVVGEIGVAMAVERLLRNGYSVAIPIVDDGYDLLAFDGRRHWRIQVKATGSEGKNRTRIRIGRGRNKCASYCPKHVDAFIVVNIRTHIAMCVPVAKAAGRSWLNFSAHHLWSDFGVLRKLKQQRC